MNTRPLESAVYERLRARAVQEGRSVDELLERLLEQTSPSSPSASDYAALEMRYQLLLRFMSDYVVSTRVNPDGSLAVEWVDGAFERIIGYPVGTIFGPHPDDAEAHARDLARTLQNEVTQGEYRVVVPDGKVLWLHISRQPIWEEAEGRVVRFISAVKDITVRKQVEFALLKSEARWRSLVESQTAFVVRTDLSGVITYSNRRFEQQYAARLPKILGANVLDTIIPEDQEAAIAAAGHCITHPDEPIQVTLRKPTVNNEIVWTLWEFNALRDENDTVNEIQCIGFDITQQIMAQEALRESEQRYRLLAVHVTDMISRHSPEGVYLYVTPSCQNLLGYTPEELVGQSAYAFFHPEDIAAIQHSHSTILELHLISTVEYRILRKDGRYTWFETTSRSVIDKATGEVAEIIAVSRDVSVRKKTDAALRENEARYKLLTEMMSDYVISVKVEPNGRLIREWITGAYTAITGYPADETNRTVEVTFVNTHPDDRERVFADLALTLQNQPTVTEYRVRKEGADPGQYTWLHIERRPVWDAVENRVVRFYAIARDITERKQAEELQREQERLQATLKREQEINTIVQKAVASLLHDIRNPLTVIDTARVILDRYSDRIDEDKRREKLDSIERQVRYMMELLNDMRTLVEEPFDRAAFKPAPIHPRTLAQITIRQMQETLGSQHRLALSADDTLNTVLLDETLVSRILFNLLSNAIKFSPAGSEVLLRVEQREAWLIFQVIDQGRGIDPDDLPYIFDPFYRAKGVQEFTGMGLGLSIVKDCVTRHHGRISVESTPGVGTRFTVEMPLRS